MIFNRNLLVVLITTVVSFSTLYVPQPLLPLLAQTFSVSAGDAGLLMTVAMLPLAFAPVVYGYFLQAIPARLMLMVALGLLALDQLCFYLVSEFWQLIGLRLIQGLLLPAIFTSLMTYCSTMVPAGNVRRVMGYYIGATILGGFVGRLAGGFFASSFDWRMAFVVVGLAQLLPLLLLVKVESDTDINFARLDGKSIARVLQNPDNRLMFLALASIFFVFSGILNTIPFRLQDIDPGTTPFLISMLYLGYLVGVPVSLFSESISKMLNDDRNGLLLGWAIHVFGLIMLLFVAFKGLLIMMFFLAAGFFLIHATLSGLINHLASEHKAVVNGVYVSIYYISGALGSWLPGHVYDRFGWNSLLLVFTLILGFAGSFILRLRFESRA